MPKQKTNKSLTKRLKISARGKIRGHKTGAGHLKSVKSPKRLRGMREEIALPAPYARHARKLMGL